MVNKGIYNYLTKLSDKDLDALVAQIKAERNGKKTTVSKKETVASSRNTDKAEQESLKNEYRSELIKENIYDRGEMLDYHMSNIGRIFKVNGAYYEIEKPSIKTSFCFAYGQNGISTTEEIDNAYNCTKAVRNDKGEYFKKENLERIDSLLKDLENDSYKFYTVNHFYKCSEDSAIRQISCHRHYEPVNTSNGERELTAEEREAYIKALNIVRNDFEKRLNTYLKRYGTSKLNTWTYLSD